MREHTIGRGLGLSSMIGGLTCDFNHALRLEDGEIEHWPYSGVKAPRLGLTTCRLRKCYSEKQRQWHDRRSDSLM